MTDGDLQSPTTARIGRWPGNDIISIGHATFRLSGGELCPYAGESPGSGGESGVADAS
jgi:hypothetical protein